MTAKKSATPRCTNGRRHWWTQYGNVGSSAPTCQHCGTPNPNYRPDDDPYRMVTR